MNSDETGTIEPETEAATVEVVAEEGDAGRAVQTDQAETIATEGEIDQPVAAAVATQEEVEVETLVVAEEGAPRPASKGASADVLPESKPGRLRIRIPGLGRKFAFALVALFVLAFGGVSYATYDYDKTYDGKLLPGIVIANVDVGGMTRGEAIKAVRGSSKTQLDRNITVRYENRKWIVTPRELGAKSNAIALVDEAFSMSRNAGLLKKAGMAVLGSELDHESDLAITYPRQGVKGFIEGVASTLDRDPIDAGVDYSTGWIEFTEPKEGRRVLKHKSRRALTRALKDESESVTLAVKTSKPAVTETALDQVLLLRIGENKLYFYQDGKITHEYVVATGSPEYPTPTGQYYVTEKRYMPTWVNPDPEGWGAGMPLSIGPGPGNPLGTRALNWSAPGIRFHGTEATYSLGYNASHGCVRMAMSDVEELYDLVDVGTPIVSLVAGPLRAQYTSDGSAN